MRSTNHIFRKDLRISFSFFADSPLQREKLEFWICTLLNICQEFKWEITLNENIYFPSDSSVERFNNFTALSYFLPEYQLTTSHFVLKKLDHVVISARPRHLEFEICVILLS